MAIFMDTCDDLALLGEGMLCMVQGIIHWMSIPSYPIWDNRIGWTVRIDILCMVQGIIHWMSIPSYVGQQDRMDSEDRHAVYGTRDYTLDVHPILCGTIGLDGQNNVYVTSDYTMVCTCILRILRWTVHRIEWTVVISMLCQYLWYKGLYSGCPFHLMCTRDRTSKRQNGFPI